MTEDFLLPVNNSSFLVATFEVFVSNKLVESFPRQCCNVSRVARNLKLAGFAASRIETSGVGIVPNFGRF